MKPADNGHGYLSLVLIKDGIKKHYRVHRLVAEAYLGEAQGRDVNHKDSCRSNNNINNLEYVTRKENCKLANMSGRTGKVKVICVETGAIYES
ncbi:MAG: HNH endonuclease [Clostridia bacterium]|nr:HNH endonuclease [Clostridia bacterium]